MIESRSIPRLMLVTDRHRSHFPLPELARLAVNGGVDAVHIREKDLPAGELRSITVDVLDAIGDQAPVIVNGESALASELRVGLHLPESMPVPDFDDNSSLTPSLIGRSVHSVESARASQGMDYLIAGHIFETGSKAGMAPLGLAVLAEIVSVARVPVLAIGGIRPENVSNVIATGAHGVAVMSGIGSAGNPERAARDYRIQLDKALLKSEKEGFKVPLSVTVNGKSIEFPNSMTIQDFLDSKKLHQNMVVVEHNGQILKRGQFPETEICSGDVLEVVHFVGGG